MPAPLLLIALIFILALLLAVVQLGLLTIAFDRLGLSPASAMLLLISSVIGSAINLPLFRIRAESPPAQTTPLRLWRLLRQAMPPFTGTTLIAINVGGSLIPIFFSLYLLLNNPLPLIEVVLAITSVALICYLASRPIQGVGIGMPLLVAPLSAAITALLIDPAHSAPLAYICGTLGVLIGADILRLRDIRNMGVSVAAIGGAGTFDGIFITGVVAVLLA
jgi:uncharacterized membrane protein